RRARAGSVLDAVAAHFRDMDAISVVDLGCGIGSTLRALAQRLPRRQHWRLVDNDLGLLARAAALGHLPDRTVSARAVDLARDLEAALDGPLNLVTTSALLDLVSAEWLERFSIEAATRRLPVYAALTYCGRASLDPAEPFDLEVIAAVNRHQRRDKGFGPALGPEAGLFAVRSFERIRDAVVAGAPAWGVAPPERGLQLEVRAGWAAAAADLGELPSAAIAAWLARRRKLVADAGAGMRVSHVDFFATPMR